MRYFLELSYKGTRYHGWQIQQNGISVQQKLNEALSVFFARNIETAGCGRTDTGVHALQFFAQFDLDYKIENDQSFCHHINCILPNDINVMNVYEVPENVSARFDATGRSYLFLIYQIKNPFAKEFATFHPKKINLELMNAASKILMEFDDFESFSKTRTEVNHFKCNITQAKWEVKNSLLVFKISANRFLRGMVRTIAGTMLWVGEKKISLDEFRKIIEIKNRKNAGPAINPEGLYLSRVEYPFIESIDRTPTLDFLF